MIFKIFLHLLIYFLGARSNIYILWIVSTILFFYLNISFFVFSTPLSALIKGKGAIGYILSIYLMWIILVNVFWYLWLGWKELPPGIQLLPPLQGELHLHQYHLLPLLGKHSLSMYIQKFLLKLSKVKIKKFVV